MNSLFQRFLNPCSAQTRLTRASGFNFYELASSTFGLVREEIEELKPGGIASARRDIPGVHPLRLQLLYGDQPELVDDSPRELVLKIRSLTSDFRMFFLQQQKSPLSALTRFRSPGNGSVLLGQFGQRFLSNSWIIDLLSGRKHREVRQPYINTDTTVNGRERFGFAFNSKECVPIPGMPLDCGPLNLPVDRTMQFDLYVTDPLDTQALLLGEQPPSAVVMRECDAVVFSCRLESGTTTPAITPGPAGKKSDEVSIYSLENIDRAGKRYKVQAPVFPHWLDLARLIVKVKRLAANPPGTNPFFNRRIKQFAGFLKLFFEQSYLRLCRINSVLIQKVHITSHHVSLPLPESPTPRMISGSSRISAPGARAVGELLRSAGNWLSVSLPHFNYTARCCTNQG
jgi:hypothetical protein